MKKEDWEKAKSRLRAPLGQVDLLCDGYSVTLVNECISMFRNGIAVYVNDEIRGSWFVQDCEERRRFIPQKETSLMTRKQIAAYNKMPKKDRGPLKKFREETFTAYQTHWTNWQALVKHLQTLQIAQANFRNMLDELERYPDLDTTEALVRVASQNLMTALTSKKDEDWSAVSVDKLMNQISGLTRAVAYKKRVELQNKSDIEAGTGDLKSALWSAMAKERPDLYKQVSAYLDRKAQEGGT